MEQVQEKAKIKIPAEAVELYTQFIHGDISRRAFVRGVERFAVLARAAAYRAFE